MLSVRDLVIFPGNSIVLMIGREFSLAAIKESLQNFNGELVITAQKSIEMNDLPGFSGLFHTGCLCKIINKVEFPDGTMKLLIKSEVKFKIESFEDKESVRFCIGKQIRPLKSSVLASDSREKILKLLNRHKEEYPKRVLNSIHEIEQIKDAELFIQRIGHFLSLRIMEKKELSIEQIKEGVFVVDTLNDKEKSEVNVRLARVQEILESESVSDSLQKLSALI